MNQRFIIPFVITIDLYVVIYNALQVDSDSLTFRYDEWIFRTRNFVTWERLLTTANVSQMLRLPKGSKQVS